MGITRLLPAVFATSVLLVGASDQAHTQSATKAKLRIVTSTTDLHDIAHAVGGDRVTVVHISEGYQDPHFVEAKPSFVLQLRKADMFAFIGLELEAGWMGVLLDGARNPKLRPGATGYVDVSQVIPVIDAARGVVDRSQGDVHPLGNPHYWLDPANGKRIARLFRDRFTALEPSSRLTFARNTARFEAQIDSAQRAWAPALAEIRGKPVVAWHTSWRYFAQFTGINIVGFMEPKPGVPATASHLAALVQTIRRTGAKVIIMEPFYDRRTADLVAKRAGAKVLILPPSVGARREARDYLGTLGYDVQQLAAALR